MEPTPSAAPAAITIVCRGTRGSLPSPGARTVRHGGNTPCLEVHAGGRVLLFDAGTGIANFTRPPDQAEFDLFLTHFHWDHIQGLPFLPLLREPDVTLRIHAEPQDGIGIDALLEAQMRPPYFPVRLEEVAARVEFHPLLGRSRVHHGVTITPFRVRHPGHTCGFRVTTGGATIVYMPDNEPELPAYPLPATWQADLLDFLRGADLLIHDAMFTDEEYATRRGWGHGTFSQAVRLAVTARVPRLLFFHHHPQRSDDELDAIAGGLAAVMAEAGTALRVGAAVEGQEIRLAPRRIEV